MIGATKMRLNNLVGNSIIQSAFQIVFGCLGTEAKTKFLSKIRSSLLRYNINYDESFTSTSTLAVELFKFHFNFITH